MTALTRVSLEAAGGPLDLDFATGDDHIAGVIRRTGTFYEAEMLADIRSRLFFAEQAVDVGAHVGNHTVYFARVLGLRTVAFEPNPESFALLAANVDRNGLGTACDLRPCAVGAVPGRGRPVGVNAANSGMARVESDPAGPVPVTTLDEAVLALPRVDLVKIDVEGWEVDVVRGGVHTLARHRPLVYVEAAAETFEALRAALADVGYVCWKRFNATPTFLFLPRERLGAA